MDSNNFNDQTGHQNPTKLPFEGEEFKNEVNLGNYSMSDHQIDMLTEYKVFTPSDEQQATITKMSSDFLNQMGYAPAQYKGTYFESRELNSKDNLEAGAVVGDTRISW